METIEKDGIMYAIILRNNEQESENSFFITGFDSTLQIGILSHPSGYIEKPHYHKIRERLIKGIPQMLYLRKGSFYVDFFDSNNIKFKSAEILEGDIIVLIDGIHMLKVRESMNALIAKLGPYMGVEEDKVEIVERQ